MKVYFYMVIAFGIMLTLFYAGVETPSSNFANLFFDMQTKTLKSPDFSSETSGTFFGAIMTALVALTAVSAVNRIQIGQFSLGGNPRDAIIAGLGSTMWLITTLDMWSVITIINSSSSWLVGIMVAIVGAFLVGFAVSIISFTGGSD